MSWYLLKNRRHVGPYSKAQLEEFKSNGQIDSSDYVIAVEELDQGNIKYQAVTEIIRFTPSKPLSGNEPASSSFSNSSEEQIIKNSKSSSTTFDDDSYEPPLGSFSEEDLEKNEVSRIFAQKLDSFDLVKGSNAGVLPPVRKPSGKTQHGVDPQKIDFNSAGESSDAQANSLLSRYKKLVFSPMSIVALGVLVLGLGYFYFSKSDAFEKGFKGLAKSSAKVISPPKNAGARGVLSRPVPLQDRAPAAVIPRPIKIPAARELPRPVEVQPEPSYEELAPPPPAPPPINSHRREFGRPGAPGMPRIHRPRTPGDPSPLPLPEDAQNNPINPENAETDSLDPAGVGQNREPESVDSNGSNENNGQSDPNAQVQEPPRD